MVATQKHLRHADRVRETAHSKTEAARSVIAASWRRSLLHHGLKPESEHAAERVSAAELASARERMGGMLEIAQPTLDRLFRTVGDAGCCVLLTDADGVVVERLGMASDDATFKDWGLWTGAVWSEATEGTNGIGTCIAEQRPVTIYRDQHFHSRNTAMSCMDAPIYDHKGELVAALDVSSCRESHTEGFVALIATAVGEAARRIESDTFRAAFPGARIVMCPGHGHGGAMLLAVDKDDLVIGATRAARKALGLPEASLDAPLPAPDILNGRVERADLESAERAEVRRALARTNGNVSAAAVMLGIGRATLYRRMKRLGLS